MRTKQGNKERDILTAAIDVFAQHGYHKAKISQIAEKANVAAGSIYIYYKNKEDLLNRIFEKLWKNLYEDLKETTSNGYLTPVEKIDAMVELAFDSFTQNPSLALVFVNEQYHLQLTNGKHFTIYYEYFMREGEKIMAEGMEQGVFSKSINIKIFREYILGAIRNLLNHWAHDPEKYPLHKIRMNVKFLLRNGILTCKD